MPNTQTATTNPANATQTTPTTTQGVVNAVVGNADVDLDRVNNATFSKVSQDLSAVVLNTYKILEGVENLNIDKINDFLAQVRNDALAIAGDPLSETEINKAKDAITQALTEALDRIQASGGVDVDSFKSEIDTKVQDALSVLDVDSFKAEVDTKMQEVKQELANELDKSKEAIKVSSQEMTNLVKNLPVEREKVLATVLSPIGVENGSGRAGCIYSEIHYDEQGSYLRDYCHFGIGAHQATQPPAGLAQKMRFPEPMSEVLAHRYCVFAISRDRQRVYFLRWNQYGNTWQKHFDTAENYVSKKVKIKAIYSSYKVHWHYVILENGDLYAKGINSYGALFSGNGGALSNWTRTATGVKSLAVSEFLADAENTNHSTAIAAQESAVLLAGYNRNAQLGAGHNSAVVTPVSKTFNSDITGVWSSPDFSGYITNDSYWSNYPYCGSFLNTADDKIYFSGYGNGGIANQAWSANTVNWIEVPYIKGQIKDVRRCEYLSMILLKNGDLYTFGRGHLGYGNVLNEGGQITPVKIASDIKKIGFTNCRQTYWVLGENGELWRFGYYGSGDGTLSREMKVVFENVKDFFEGYYHVVALGNDNVLYDNIQNAGFFTPCLKAE